MATIPLSAQQVTQEKAFKIAQEFLGKNDATTAAQRKTPRKTPVLQLANSSDKIFVFNDVASGAASLHPQAH